jgi:diaminohydroxyphosphoribosylaminopyrimidine deaminase / 5-amino-6-(5-phosphoribosylamino)uracil reductase
LPIGTFEYDARAMSKHEQWMRLALKEAERAIGRTRPNPLVGAVIVKNGRLLAKGFHKRAGLAHAEVEALQKLGGRAPGADVYCTLEPCNHMGRTGPCSEALIAAGVRRVFVGMRDPNPIVDGRGLRKLRAAGIEVHLGLLEDECLRLNEAFTHFITTRRPYVIAKIAQSLDGRVATHTGESKWVTSEAARREGHVLRNACDAVLVGIGTVLADDPELTCRVRGGRDPLRVVVDTQARTPTRARVVRIARSSKAATMIAVGTGAPRRRTKQLEAAGAQLMFCKERRGVIDLEDLVKQLGKLELLSVLVEGGPTLLGGFFDRGLVNKLHAFIAPRVVGGQGALSSVGGEGVARLRDSMWLKDVRVSSVGDDLWITGYPERP